MTKRVLILSGGGDYDDPWHPFIETSSHLQELLIGFGVDVTTSDEVAVTMAAIRNRTAHWDLIVANFGSAAVSTPSDSAVVDGMIAHLAGGGSLLVMHVATTLFPDDPRWEPLIGGRWVRGTTFHPPIGRATVQAVPSAHWIVDEESDFEVLDELYTNLRVAVSADVLVTHRHDGRTHPLAWAWNDHVVVDALGHDGRSYAAQPHRDLLERIVRWLLRQPSPVANQSMSD